MKQFLKTLTIKKALIIWLIAMGISVIFSKDINFSMWGSVERMEGYYQMILYFVFFIFLTEFFVKKEQWKKIFITITFLGTIMGLLALGQYFCGLQPETMALTFQINKCNWGGNIRPETTIGNPAFLAGYLILVISFSGLNLLLVENKKWVFWFIPIGLIQIFGLWVAGIRGSFVGVIIGVIIYLLMRKFCKNAN